MSPIKGVSEIRRFPRLGKIRLGEKKISKRTGETYPSATDYFVCPPEVQQVYGPKPKELDVIFPVEDQEAIFSQWYKRYGSARGMICRGDGETATVTKQELVVDEQGKEGDVFLQEEIECLGQDCEFYQQQKCRRVASLRFMLPRVGGIGVWQLDTSSFYSIINLNSAMDLIRTAAGRVSMIPLKLCVEPQEATVGGNKRKIHVLQIRCEETNIFKLRELAERRTIELKPEAEPRAPESPPGEPGPPKPEKKVKIKLTPIEHKIEELKVKVGDKVYYRILGMEFSVEHYNQLSPAGQAEFATELAKLAKHTI